MPADWQRLSIGELASQRVEKVRPNRGDRTPYVALEHIPNGGGRLLGTAAAGGAASHKTRFRAGDTLFGKLRPNLRKVVRARFDGVCSTDILAIGAMPGADEAFLYHLLASEVVYRHVMGDITGTKMPRTSWERLADLSLSVPPLPEQRAIAAVLDAIDDGIERTEAVIAATEELRRALLHDLLTRGLPGWHSEWNQVPGLGTVPACWDVVRLGGVLLDIEAGKSPNCESRPARDDEWGVLKVSALSWGHFLPEENKALPPDVEPDRSLEVQPGDLLVSRANTPDLVGRAVLVSETRPQLLLCDKTLRLKPDLARVDAPFLNLVLATDLARTQISGAATGSSRSMYNVSQESLRSVRLPMPPAPERRLISELVRSLDITLEAHRAGLEALRGAKSSTADALLSGRMRVPLGAPK